MCTQVNKLTNSLLPLSTLIALCCLLFLVSCENSDIAQPVPDVLTKANAFEHSIDLAVLLENIDDVEVAISTRSTGYDALAKGKGVIPAGEYAGHHFNVTISGYYSGLGANTLVTGEATVKIRSQHFASFEICDSGFESFCNGEGSLMNSPDGTEMEFTVYGQVEHLRASTPHNHLFAGFASTAGTMNFNVVNQSGSVTEHPVGPNHDPDIGLLENLPAKPVKVTPH